MERKRDKMHASHVIISRVENVLLYQTMYALDNTYIFISCKVGSHQVGMEARQTQDRPDGEETNNQFHNITRGVKV